MALHRYVFHNGRIVEASTSGLYPGQLGLLSGWGVFSTLRVIDGMMFAWDRHWTRMSRDAQLLNVEMPADPDEIEQQLVALIEKNQAPNCTLRFVVVRNGGGMWEGPSSGRASDIIGLTADSKHWGESVRLGVQPHARYAASDFTRAKIISWAHNLRWAERAQQQGFDEVILLNEFDRVTECTSANIFAAFGSEVATPPTSEGCLPGVTRELVLERPAPGLKVVERPLTVDDLHHADEVFITSTTRSLVRVREIDGRARRDKVEVCEGLTTALEEYLAADIRRRKDLVSARLMKA